MSKKVIGFCGLGLMGTPMVRHLLRAGYAVNVWNRSPDKVDPLAEAGAIRSDSPKSLAQHSDIVLLCLTDQHAVEQVVFGDQGVAQGIRAGGILVDHSSIAPDATRDMAARLHDVSQGIWVDAPVSGGVAGTEKGILSIMAGGPQDAIETVSPVLRSYAQNITRLGDAGAGQVAKLCNQVIVGTTLNAIAEAIALGAHAGIDVAALHKALAGGWADSVLLQIFVPRMTTGYDKVVGASNTLLKDINNVLALAEQNGTTLSVAQTVQKNFVQMAQQGLGEADLSDIVQIPWPDRP